MCNKVSDSADVVIPEQGFSIVDTREPANAIPLSSICYHILLNASQNDQISLEGRHQEVRRFVSPGLHHITSVDSHCGMSRNERHTLGENSFGSFLPGLVTIRSEGGVGVWRRGLMRGTPFD
jgi:hypothetical protein